MLRVKRPITHKGKKFLVNREPKLIENTKQALFLEGRSGSDLLSNCLRDLYHLKKPDALKLGKRHDILPFEDSTLLEKLSKKYDTSLIFFTFSNKKRPNNLILCRMYDQQLLDLVELGITNYKGISEFSTEKIPTGLKPCIIFAGPDFETKPEYQKIQNIFVDFFQRENATNIRLQGIEHVLMFTASGDNIFMRSYRIILKKSGCATPRIELEELGPSIDFTVRRTRFASDDLFKEAVKQPSELKVKPVKNVRRDVFNNKIGRMHVGRQSSEKLQTRKMKGLRKPWSERRKKAKKDQK